jgi:hypothetical protein
MWFPIGLAMLASTLIFLWLLSGPPLGMIVLGGPPSSDSDRVPSALEVYLLPADANLSPVFTPEVLTWGSDILRWADTYDLDPNLVATVMQIESCGHPSVLSSSGAIGLFQVMPFHFPDGEDPFDPEINAMRGLAYLARGLGLSGGRIDLALAGYNGGHGMITRDQSQWAPETQRYVTWGNGILNDIAGGRTTSPTIQAWLQAGGERLCRSASHAIASLQFANSP